MSTSSVQDFGASKIPAEFSDSIGFQSELWHMLTCHWPFVFFHQGLWSPEQKSVSKHKTSSRITCCR